MTTWGICKTYWSVLRGGAPHLRWQTFVCTQHQTDLTTELLSGWCNWFWKNKQCFFSIQVKLHSGLLWTCMEQKMFAFQLGSSTNTRAKEMSMCWTDGCMNSGIMWYNTITKRGYSTVFTPLKKSCTFPLWCTLQLLDQLLDNAVYSCVVTKLNETHPEVCMAVHHHGPLDQLIGALQQVVAGHNTSVVDQQVHFTDLSAYFLCCGIHALPLAHINHVRIHLRLKRRDLFHTTNSSWGKTHWIIIIWNVENYKTPLCTSSFIWLHEFNWFRIWRHLGENLRQVADDILNDYLTKIIATIGKTID